MTAIYGSVRSPSGARHISTVRVSVYTWSSSRPVVTLARLRSTDAVPSVDRRIRVAVQENVEGSTGDQVRGRGHRAATIRRRLR